ncbi:hypothetical protein RM844_10350 [Streptomyces sp. DSM 44915]|uniref:Uncharacterized protein n=1 Tax=Streptomyces chisholmiae TaxID=3075540 RepID=A0ABU2JR40_9ACTN|nr:hypothetical protein [Streptomyces sp. DSM 44915]MDT0266693.1 hypothetical protein [Streptomyces sp. DSM 44915]
MKDHQIIALFDGAAEVEVVTQGRLFPVLAIAHEYGYELTWCKISPQTGISRFAFARDDDESARRRAAWAKYHYETNGAWWATAAPGPSASAISPMTAAEARFGLYLYEKRPLIQQLWPMVAIIVAALAGGVWFLVSAPLGALPCLGVALAGGASLLWYPRRRARKEAEYRRTLADFDRQRVFWSHEEQGGGG